MFLFDFFFIIINNLEDVFCICIDSIVFKYENLI